jgi:hypothetical protein
MNNLIRKTLLLILVYYTLKFILKIVFPIVYILAIANFIMSDNTILFIIGLILPGFLPVVVHITTLMDNNDNNN